MRKRIVVITREGYLGTKIEVGEMGDCREYDSKNKQCYPSIDVFKIQENKIEYEKELSCLFRMLIL